MCVHTFSEERYIGPLPVPSSDHVNNWFLDFIEWEKYVRIAIVANFRDIHKPTLNPPVMNKYELQGKIKSTGTAYLFWFLLGAHFAYLGRWGMQLLFWFTLGGIGVWAIVELFLISGRVQKYNAPIYQQLADLDKKEKAEDMAKNIAMIKAAKS